MTMTVEEAERIYAAAIGDGLLAVAAEAERRGREAAAAHIRDTLATVSEGLAGIGQTALIGVLLGMADEIARGDLSRTTPEPKR